MSVLASIGPNLTFVVKDGGFRQFLIALSGIKSEGKYVC